MALCRSYAPKKAPIYSAHCRCSNPGTVCDASSAQHDVASGIMAASGGRRLYAPGASSTPTRPAMHSAVLATSAAAALPAVDLACLRAEPGVLTLPAPRLITAVAASYSGSTLLCTCSRTSFTACSMASSTKHLRGSSGRLSTASSAPHASRPVASSSASTEAPSSSRCSPTPRRTCQSSRRTRSSSSPSLARVSSPAFEAHSTAVRRSEIAAGASALSQSQSLTLSAMVTIGSSPAAPGSKSSSSSSTSATSLVLLLRVLRAPDARIVSRRGAAASCCSSSCSSTCAVAGAGV
mmetsp:Transcript_13560/g.42623  ORF Transcript_13560/g.42623 Transcript_13560/m.42623 type:complete len:294 (-) Transcript_13560:207-1088(-)